MPITSSAKKALRQNISRRAKNAVAKKQLSETIKVYKKTVLENKKEAEKQLPKVYQALDKAAKNNLIKKNKASRLKSRLVKRGA
jgi:small subunit ribosomal protein S20